MHWLDYVSYFFGGAFLANAVPHFVTGVTGRPFQSPFAKPPGKGLSSSTVNIVWAAANAVIGYLLIFHIGNFAIRSFADAAAAALGAFFDFFIRGTPFWEITWRRFEVRRHGFWWSSRPVIVCWVIFNLFVWRMLKKLSALTILLFAISTQGYAAAEIGQPAPDFSAIDINGKTQSLGQYKGRIIVLEWNNPGCPFVHKHYDSGNMQQLQTYAKTKGAEWLTINSAGEGKEGFMSNEEAKANLAKVGGKEDAYILDPNGKIGHLYGATATPNMFVINQKGILVYGGAIDDKPTADQDDIKTATNYVHAAIDSILAGTPVAVNQTKAYGCSVKYSE